MKKLINVIALLSILLTTISVDASTKKKILLDCEDYVNHEVISLACNIYFESRGEGAPGMLLVALTTRNRVESKIYPNTYAEVTWEIRTDAKTKKKVAMYSWTLDGQPDFIYNLDEWIKSLHLAAEFHAERIGRDKERTPDITFGCMWYHNETVSPFWADSYHKTIKVKGHQCYAVNEDAYHEAIMKVVNGS